jgi:uncharacterized protein YprB with RNaseH-like and TPR domain
MIDLTKQLETLRQKVARIEGRDDDTPRLPLLFGERREIPFSRNPTNGCEVESEAGRHWELERMWPSHYRHGLSDVGALWELAADALAPLGDDTIEAPPARWAFLDTETTGLAGGSGTVAFLVGVGVISPDGFRLKQYFLREPVEETSALTALAKDLAEFDVLITYNGKAFDVPLLETRYLMNRLKSPFTRLRHIDLLFGARRLWRLRLERCRLQDLEQRILAHERVGDIGGAFIPNLYFDYLRNGNAAPLEPVLFHNAIDILSLACLTAIVPQAFQQPELLKHGEELAGIARWFRKEERLEEAATLMRLALRRRMPDTLVYETLWHLADIERKLARHVEAVQSWTELSTVKNAFQAQALERLGLHFERVEKDYAKALEFTRAALALAPSPELAKREARLAARVAKGTANRLL